MGADTPSRTAADEFVSLMDRLRRLRAANSLPPDIKVSPALMPIISYLAKNPDSSVKEIARALGLATPTVSVSLRRLERQGLVSRRAHPHDNRAIQLSLTASGERLHEQVMSFRRQLAAEMLQGLDSDERDELLRLLGKAMDAVEVSSGRGGSASGPGGKRRIV